MKYTNLISKKILRLPMNKYLNKKSQILVKKNIYNFFKLPEFNLKMLISVISPVYNSSKILKYF